MEDNTAELDWPAKIATEVVDRIDLVKSKTTKPVETAAKGAIAFVALLTMIPALIALILIAVVRGISYIPWEIGYSYLILGAVLYLPGLFFLNKARTPAPTAR